MTIFLPVLLPVVLPVVLASGSAHAADCTPAEVVAAFAQAADTRQVAALQDLLHPEFRVVFAMAGGPDTSVLSRSGWFALLNDGKIGGTPRTLTVHATGGDAAVSHVLATL